MTHSHLKTVAISNEVPFGGAVVVAEHLFVHITEQVERLYCYVRAFQSALEQAPEVFQSVCVNLPVNVPFRMVYRLMSEALCIQSLIGQERIAVDRALGSNVRPNLRLQMVLAPRRNDIRMNLSAAFKNTENGCLVFDSAFCNHALATTEM